jgi:16S rRNA (uracil1498-N3)-methyltransferase
MPERTRGLHRFFVSVAESATPPDLGILADARVGSAIVLTGTQAHQISRVLRLRAGQQLVLLDGRGHEFLVRLDEVRSSTVSGLVEAVLPSRPEPALHIALYQALVPRDRFETVLQKGTEVGISRFVPTWCERSIVPGGDAVDDKRLERWRRIVTEAAEQCERGVVPEISRPLRFAEAMAEAAAAGPILVAWEREADRSVRAGLHQALSGKSASRLPRAGEGLDGGPTLSLFVGPEGGVSEAEIALATSFRALTISLGRRVLRTETAGPVLAALALYEAGDLDPLPATQEPA